MNGALADIETPPAVGRLRAIEQRFTDAADVHAANGAEFSRRLASVPAPNVQTVSDAPANDMPRIVPLSDEEVRSLPEPDIAVNAPAAFPDAASGANASSHEDALGAFRLGDIFSQASSMLQRAQQAERAVAEGEGSVLAMSVERARANAMLSVAGAAANKMSTAVSTFVNMAV